MKNKILIFIGGLVAGVTVGVLFSVAIKTLISQFRELHISLNKIDMKQSQLSQRLDSIQGKLVPDVKKPTSGIQQPASKSTVPVSQRSLVASDNMKAANVTGTPSSSISSATTDSDVVVMTNQLVSVLSVPLRNDDTISTSKKNHETDSTIASMSDIRSGKQNAQYRVEFWKSPLNYKGYKMSKGKIVLYGMNPVTPVNITQDDDSYYLVLNQSAFKVEYTDEYKPFDRVTDKNILKKLGL